MALTTLCIQASIGVYLISAFGIIMPSANDASNFTTAAPVITTVTSNYTGVSKL